ncbi:NADH-quinone oxidoreductase subunit NuoK [Paraglaciecola arctica]|jgi:NADH-quinone oxidoreductase subunit K|uniref:NADH-quinone oxidoreductase subunit K n=2 Tax=Paraglaciecola TaxID=1621534 RepID=K6YN52_9ALTE|nr:NADH-quinone oxidoreductase subunit K [Paraglaciecola arctica BSs20135]|tara:strand:- start:1131 stop:1436 length:306 start_codon:yes stop_codon:yes gene_type:complete
MTVPIEHGFVLVALLWAIGLVGLLSRKNTLFMLMSMEIMLNAGALAFILAGSLWQQADGQVIYILILSIAAAEVGLGLALLIRLRQHIGDLDIDKLDEMKG